MPWYRIERELGKGASGTVYLAPDGFRDVRVAVIKKIMGKNRKHTRPLISIGWRHELKRKTWHCPD